MMETISNQIKHCTEIVQSIPSLKEKDIRNILKNEYPIFARKVLKIRTDDGVVPFIFNREQWYIHNILEAQKKRTGMVRAIVLKGRQQGCSTYVGGRYYHQTTHKKGKQTFILTHEGKATDVLFGMVKRFWDNANSSIKPERGNCNAKELLFPKLDSCYKVGTADNESVGRSMNNQYFHGSEVGYWRVGQKLAAGAFQSVHLVPDTEIILESTANGVGGFFYDQWKLAEKGLSDYIAIFIPWYWHVEYRLPVPDNFLLTDEDLEYKEAYNLNMEQMSWRRSKQQELGEILFKQEYPATPDEAFQVTGKNKLIDTLLVTKARKQKPYKSIGAIIAAYDPKRDGKDRDAFIYRQGLNMFDLEYQDYNTPGEKIAKCKRILTGENNNIIPDFFVIDYGGGGWEYGMLLKQDMPSIAHKIRIVNFGAKANQPELYTNRRNEMWQEMLKWFEDANTPPSIPDNDELHADLVMPGYTYDSNNRKVMESKEKMKKEYGVSPDGGDVGALTHAEKFIINHVMEDGRANQMETDYDVFG